MSPRTLRSSILCLSAILFFLALQAAAQSKAGDQEQHIQRIDVKAVDLSLNEKEPPLQLGLQKLMQLYKIPGFSMAVIDDYKIAWTKAYGVTDLVQTRP